MDTDYKVKDFLVKRRAMLMLKEGIFEDKAKKEAWLSSLTEFVNLPHSKEDYFTYERYLVNGYADAGFEDKAIALNTKRMAKIGWNNSHYKFTRDFTFLTPESVDLFESLPIVEAKNMLAIGCHEGQSALYFLDNFMYTYDSVDLVDIENLPNLHHNIKGKNGIKFHHMDSNTFKFEKMYDFIHVNGSKDRETYETDIRRSLEHLNDNGVLLLSYMSVMDKQLRSTAYSFSEEESYNLEKLNIVGLKVPFLALKKLPKN